MKLSLLKRVIGFCLFLFIVLTGSLHAGKYNPWIDRQIKLIEQSEDQNLTDEALSRLIEERNRVYMNALQTILENKAQLNRYTKMYDGKIFKLKKMMEINRHHGNKEAVLRDEVQIKSYKLIQIQNRMLRKIFKALDEMNRDDFEKKMYDIFAQTQNEINKLDDKDKLYRKLLKQKPKNRLERQIQKNIKEFYALWEINIDILRYFAENVKRVYRLNKYAQYHILRPALFIDNHVKMMHLNRLLEPYGLSVVKLVLMLLISLLIYLVRKVLLGIIESVLVKVGPIGRYAEEIIGDIKAPISYLLLVLNAQLLFFVYNDFSGAEMAGKIFHILYTIFLTLIVFRTLNSIARVKLEYIDRSNRKIKSELFNLTVKIINFIVLIVGALFVLYFAGVDLTAVLSGLGIGGFAVALAARESLSNFFGTVSILMSEVFSQGDWIEVDGKEGTVVEIGLRVTTIRTFDNALIAIPNATLANKELKNWSKRIIGRRIKMKVSLTYDSDRKALQRTVEEIRTMLAEHPQIATERTQYQERGKKSAKLVSKEDELGVKRILLVYLDAFSDSSIDILIYAFTKSTVWREWLETKEDVLYKIMEIVERNGLRFAFPTVTIDYPAEEKESKK